MSKISQRILIIVGAIIGVFIILILIMGFFARRNNQTLLQFVQSRREARRAAQTENITDSATPITAGMNQRKLTSGGRERTFLLYVPASYKSQTATPLVIGYHGGFGEGENQEKLTHMSQVAEKEGFIIAYPDGINRHWNDGRARAIENGDNVDDVQFTKDLIAAISSRLNIDSQRIYATGISNGGMMSYRVACEMTQTFAAIAPVSSAMPIEQKSCAPQGGIPVMIIQGTADPLIPFNGGEMALNVGTAIPTLETLQFWITNNKANTTPTVTEIPDTTPDDGTHTTKSVYRNEKDGNEVVFLKIENGGHTWAGGNQYAKESAIGKTARDFDASEVIWDFFKNHSR